MRQVNIKKLPHIALVAFALLGCGASSSDSRSTSQIAIMKMQFSVPRSVPQANQLELDNNDSVAHNFMLMDESFSVDIAIGATVVLPHFKPGSYPFHCHIHPNMVGTLVVS